jgi:putative drug exporter of the RND superfamily
MPIIARRDGKGQSPPGRRPAVSRHRNGLLAGQSPEDAAVTALNTAGRAVLLAGLMVCIAMLFALQASFLYGVAVAVAVVIGLTMLASLTLLPAMLGFLGPKVLRRGERKMLAQQGRQVEQAGGFWLRWAEGLGRKPQLPAVLALAVIAVLAIPFLSMRVGLDDASADPPSSTTYQACQLLAKGFGSGFNGPLLVVGQVNSPPTRHASRRSVIRPAASRAWPRSPRRSSARRQGRGGRGVPDHRTTRGDRPRHGRRHLRRRLHHPHRLRPGRDAHARALQLVAARVAGPGLPRLHLEPAQPRARTQSCALPPCPRTVQPAPSRIAMALSRG